MYLLLNLTKTPQKIFHREWGLPRCTQAPGWKGGVPLHCQLLCTADICLRKVKNTTKSNSWFVLTNLSFNIDENACYRMKKINFISGAKELRGPTIAVYQSITWSIVVVQSCLEKTVSSRGIQVYRNKKKPKRRSFSQLERCSKERNGTWVPSAWYIWTHVWHNLGLLFARPRVSSEMVPLRGEKYLWLFSETEAEICSATARGVEGIQRQSEGRRPRRVSHVQGRHTCLSKEVEKKFLPLSTPSYHSEAQEPTTG